MQSDRPELNVSARALKSATDARRRGKITSATALAQQALDAYIRAARILVRGQLVGNVMSILSLLLNVLWIVCGGLWMAVGWVIAAVVMAITIIGLPWTRAAFNIAAYTLLPFEQKVVSRAAYGHNDMGTGPLGVLGNVLWLILAGWRLALGHLITAIMLAITIVGIPFAWAHAMPHVAMARPLVADLQTAAKPLAPPRVTCQSGPQPCRPGHRSCLRAPLLSAETCGRRQPNR